MAELFASGRIVEIAIAAVALEMLVLLLWNPNQRRGTSVAALLGHLGAGMFLLLALRAALTGEAWPWSALWMTAALPAHVYGLWSDQMSRRPA